MTYRTDRNNNPAAFTTDIAKEAGLVLNTDYEFGDPFTSVGMTLYTAKLLGDPVALTIKVIDKIGYYTKSGAERWTYMAIPFVLWHTFSLAQKTLAIAQHYKNEGGIAMAHLFAAPVDLQAGSILTMGDSTK